MPENLKGKVTTFVMQTVANDYESLESLAHYSPDPAANSFSQDQITGVLIELERQGYIRAFLYSENAQSFDPTDINTTKLETLWFGLKKRVELTYQAILFNRRLFEI